MVMFIPTILRCVKPAFLMVLFVIAVAFIMHPSPASAICGRKSCVVPDDWSPPSGGDGGGSAPQETPADWAIDAYNTGLEFYRQGRWAEAEKYFRKAISHDPSDHDFHRLLSNVLIELGRYAEAESAAKEAIRLNSRDGKAYNALARAYYYLGRYEDAMAMYRLAVKFGSKTARDNLASLQQWFINNIYNHGSELLDKGDNSGAEDVFRKVIKLDPKNADAYTNLGVALARQKRYLEAIEAYRKALRLKPGDPLIINNLFHNLRFVGWIEGTKGNYGEAERYYGETLKLVRKYPELRKKLKTLLIEEFKDANTRWPENIRLREIVARTLVKLDPKDGESHRMLGKTLIEKGDLSGGKKAFLKASRLLPEDHTVHTEVAYLLLNAEDFKGAEKAYRKALPLIASSDTEEIGATHAMIGYVLEHKGDDESALKEYREAIRIFPDLDVAHLWLGKLLLKSGEFEEAEKELMRALELSPQENKAATQALTDFYARLGNIFMEQGNLEAANHHLNKALNLDPNNNVVKNELEKVTNELEKKRHKEEARKKEARGLALMEIEEEITLMVHGKPTKSSKRKKLPDDTKIETDNPGKELESATETGGLAAGANTKEEASGRAQLVFDTAGIGAKPLEKLIVDGRSPTHNFKVPKEMRKDEKVVYLLERRDEAKKVLEAYEKELEKIKETEKDTPEKKVKIVKAREKIDKTKNKVIFYNFSLNDRISQLKKQGEAQDNPEGKAGEGNRSAL